MTETRPIETWHRLDLLAHIRRQDRIIDALVRTITRRAPTGPRDLPRPPAADPSPAPSYRVSDPTVRAALEKCGGNIAATARELNLSYQTLYKRIRAGHT